MPTYQMLWDCSQCDTKGLLGVDHRFCPTCGAPQDPEARYFPKEGEEVAVEDHVFVGADKRCPACDTPNAANAQHCVACGAPLEGAKSVRRRDEQAAGQADSAQAARAEHAADRKAEEQARIEEQADKIASRGKSKKSAAGTRFALLGLGATPLLLLGGIFATLLVGMALCCGLSLYSTPTAVQATGHRWERTIALEALMPVTDSAWENQVPSDARGVSCHKKVRSTKKVKTGEDCKTVRVDNGDGSFSKKKKCTPTYRSEDVHDDWCSYTVDRWRTVRTERAGEGRLGTPAWPKATPRPGERIGAKSERYEVSFQQDKAELQAGQAPEVDWCSFSESRWRSIRVGSRWEGSRGVTGSLDCSSLRSLP